MFKVLMLKDMTGNTQINKENQYLTSDVLGEGSAFSNVVALGLADEVLGLAGCLVHT